MSEESDGEDEEGSLHLIMSGGLMVLTVHYILSSTSFSMIACGVPLNSTMQLLGCTRQEIL